MISFLHAAQLYFGGDFFGFGDRFLSFGGGVGLCEVGGVCVLVCWMHMNCVLYVFNVMFVHLGCIQWLSFV